jgi:hypothetical protein
MPKGIGYNKDIKKAPKKKKPAKKPKMKGKK